MNSNLESTNSNLFENNEQNLYLNPRETGSTNNAGLSRNSTSANSSAEINRLSSELKSRISRDMDEMMNSFNVQIQRVINDAISNQCYPKSRMPLSGHVTQKGWNVSTGGPEMNTEVLRNEKAKNNSKSELVQNRLNHGPIDNAYDMVTGENECPILVPEFLTGRMPSRSHLNQSHDDLSSLLDTTIPAQERTAPAAESDLINRLADVLTSMQNRPTAQLLTIRSVNSNTMTFDGKSEKFELFEELFHAMIKMKPEMSEQMKINHFH